MRGLLKMILWLAPLAGRAQTVQVYVNDTTFVNESIAYSGTDTVTGVIKAVYTAHGNAPAYEVNFYYGYRSGLVKMYYPSGKLMRTVVYMHGDFHGETAWYNPEGKLVIKGEYVKGVKDGYWAYRQYGFMGKFDKGLKHGWWKYNLPDGNKGKMKFKKGKLLHPKNGRVYLPPNVPRAILMEGVTEL